MVTELPRTAKTSSSRPSRPMFVFACLALAGLVFAMLQSLISPALPVIADALDTATADVGWLVTAYLLAAAIATPIAGRLGDIFGRRRVLLIVLALLICGTLIAALSDSLPVLLTGRAIQGCGGAVLPLAFGIVRDELPKERVGFAIGLLSSLLGSGAALGSVLAGPIVDQLSWHWLFWIPLILLLLATAGIVYGVPRSASRTPSSIHWTGAILLSAGLVCLLLALSKGAAWGWSSITVLALFGGAALSLTAWAVAERRAKEPLVDTRLLVRRGVWTTNTIGLAFGVATFGSTLLIPFLLQLPVETGYGLGRSVSESGLYLLPATIAMIIFAPVSGALHRYFGAKYLLVAGTGMALTGFTSLALAHATTWQMLTGVCLMGIGIGLASSAMTNALLAAVPPTQSSAATSLNALARTIGGSIGTAALAAVLAANTTAGVPAEAGFTYGFWICAGALAAALVSALVLPADRPRSH
ncbi:MFS transporter [Streptomyces sp. 7G]|uniref:MFS transporter n=1 Tax=Streptomyces sp. 7G TaxID=2877241 RepID=UPI001CD65B7D|nr:MFS transporter [Streptomyces sp. 7G]MCA1273225.1 MFS transporter [Streptomyces sp. 7G]